MEKHSGTAAAAAVANFRSIGITTAVTHHLALIVAFIKKKEIYTHKPYWLNSVEKREERDAANWC